jgi:Tol biopolymer transport system component
MSIAPSSKVGTYEVVAAIGSGGMGAVYRAHDTKLNRDVALKVLLPEVADNPERLARFRREAQILASLNHPNIAHIYGLEESGGVVALVLELVEGPTLADRIAKGAIPIDEALPIAKQIAEALEAAHEQGIIHRDLKPANVKVRDDGTVKVLDFGLAKAMEPLATSGVSAAAVTNSPTITSPALMTGVGVLMGTAAYMSPEQAKGRPADKRCDIWAFGCVLYEMLTGARVFPGDNIAETLAAVIKSDPEWRALPSTLPTGLAMLIRSCLVKDSRRRLQAIGDARVQIEDLLGGAGEVTNSRGAPFWQRPLLWAILACTLLAVSAFLSFILLREAPPARGAPVRFEIPLPADVSYAPAALFALSPDGRWLAFVGRSGGNLRIWIRNLGSLDVRALAGTETASDLPIFWSWDSTRLAFQAEGHLKTVALAGGAPQSVCDLGSRVIVDGAWNKDEVIIFGTNPGGIMRAPATGGVCTAVTALNVERKETRHIAPKFLADGTHFLYLRLSSLPENSGMFVGSLKANPEAQSAERILATSYQSQYVPSSDGGPGQLLSYRDGTVVAQPFDDKRLQVTGESRVIVEGVASFLAGGLFRTSTNGVLVYRTGTIADINRAVWLDRLGQEVPGPVDVGIGPYLLDQGGTLAGDGQAVVSARTGTDRSLWMLDFKRGTSRRFTFGPGRNVFPISSSDGRRIVFRSDRDGPFNLYQKPADSSTDEEPLLQSAENKTPTSWSADGRFLLYTVQAPRTKGDIWVLPLNDPGKRARLIATAADEDEGRFSPDGHWVAYTSDLAAHRDVYVRRFAPDEASQESGGGNPISKDGGSNPVWRHDSKGLFYAGADGTVKEVDLADGPARPGSPRLLFTLPAGASNRWLVSADGERFLVTVPAGQGPQIPFTVVLNWPAELRK